MKRREGRGEGGELHRVDVEAAPTKENEPEAVWRRPERKVYAGQLYTQSQEEREKDSRFLGTERGRRNGKEGVSFDGAHHHSPSLLFTHLSEEQICSDQR